MLEGIAQPALTRSRAGSLLVPDLREWPARCGVSSIRLPMAITSEADLSTTEGGQTGSIRLPS
jgi:hypothetical protein